MRFLLIATIAFEDYLLLTPLIRAIKQRYSDSTIDAVLSGRAVEQAKLNRLINNVLEVKYNYFKHLSVCRKGQYDYVLDFDSVFFSGMFCSLLFRKRIKIDRLEFQRWYYVRFKPRNLMLPHWVGYIFKVLKRLDLSPDDYPIDFFIPHADEVEYDWLPEPFREGYVLVSLNAEYATRKLTPEKLLQFCQGIKRPIVFVGTTDDYPSAQFVVDALTARPTFATNTEWGRDLQKNYYLFNGCGKFNFNQQASLITRAHSVATPDSVFMHIASAYNKPTGIWWGNTTPMFGRYPYKAKFVIFENNQLECRPCSVNGLSSCPLSHFNCINQLGFDLSSGIFD